MSKTRQIKKTLITYSKVIASLADEFHNIIIEKKIEHGSDDYNLLVKKFDHRYRVYCKQKENNIIKANPDGFINYLKQC